MSIKTREQIVEEALSWCGTPYLHMGYVKGLEGGVDCAMINIGVFRDFDNVIPKEYDPRPYAAQWYLHRSEEKYLEWFRRYAREVDAPGLGDIVLFKFGRCVSHSGIVVAPGTMVHAFREAGMVIQDEVSTHMDRFHSYWSVK